MKKMFLNLLISAGVLFGTTQCKPGHVIADQSDKTFAPEDAAQTAWRKTAAEVFGDGSKMPPISFQGLVGGAQAFLDSTHNPVALDSVVINPDYAKKMLAHREATLRHEKGHWRRDPRLDSIAHELDHLLNPNQVKELACDFAALDEMIKLYGVGVALERQLASVYDKQALLLDKKIEEFKTYTKSVPHPEDGRALFKVEGEQVILFRDPLEKPMDPDSVDYFNRPAAVAAQVALTNNPEKGVDSVAMPLKEFAELVIETEAQLKGATHPSFAMRANYMKEVVETGALPLPPPPPQPVKPKGRGF